MSKTRITHTNRCPRVPTAPRGGRRPRGPGFGRLRALCADVCDEAGSQSREQTDGGGMGAWRVAHPDWKPNPNIHRPKYVMTREEAVAEGGVCLLHPGDSDNHRGVPPDRRSRASAADHRSFPDESTEINLAGRGSARGGGDYPRQLSGLRLARSFRRFWGPQRGHPGGVPIVPPVLQVPVGGTSRACEPGAGRAGSGSRCLLLAAKLLRDGASRHSQGHGVSRNRLPNIQIVSSLDVAMSIFLCRVARLSAERMFSFVSGSSARGIFSADPSLSCSIPSISCRTICLCLPSRPLGTST